MKSQGVNKFTFYRAELLNLKKRQPHDFRQDKWMRMERQKLVILCFTGIYLFPLVVLALDNLSPFNISKIFGYFCVAVFCSAGLFTIYVNYRRAYLYSLGLERKATLTHMQPYKGIWRLTYQDGGAFAHHIGYAIYEKENSLFAPDVERPEVGQEISLQYNPQNFKDAEYARFSHKMEFCLSKRRLGEITNDQESALARLHCRKMLRIWVVGISPIVVMGSIFIILGVIHPSLFRQLSYTLGM